MALFLGCVSDALYPETTAATARGAPAERLRGGDPARSGVLWRDPLPLGRRRARPRPGAAKPGGFDPAAFDAIIVNAAGCGAMLKDYAHLLPPPSTRPRGSWPRSRTSPSSWSSSGPIAAPHSLPMKVTYHDACHLCHGQQIRSQPRQLLAMIPGVELVPLEETEICCGAAGTYNLTQPEMSERLGRRKMDFIAATGARWSPPATSAASSSPARPSRGDRG